MLFCPSLTTLLLLTWFSPEERCHRGITTHHSSLELCTSELIGLIWTWFFHKALCGRLELLSVEAGHMTDSVECSLSHARGWKLSVFWFVSNTNVQWGGLVFRDSNKKRVTSVNLIKVSDFTHLTGNVFFHSFTFGFPLCLGTRVTLVIPAFCNANPFCTMVKSVLSVYLEVFFLSVCRLCFLLRQLYFADWKASDYNQLCRGKHQGAL